VTSTVCILLIVLIALIGVALVMGGNRPVKTIAVIFTLIGMWVGTRDAGQWIINELGRMIKPFV
jgi:hypothetical protein